MMSRVGQKPMHLERFPFLSPIQKLLMTSALSLEAPTQKPHLAILCRLKGRVGRAHDTLP